MSDYPARCWICGKGAQWTRRMVGPDGRLFGYCRKCQTVTPVDVLPIDVHKAEAIEEVRRFKCRRS